uniref:hypothetical protein n=1 Tax=Pasteurella testudinis TaxID=761 RepID=UPI001ABEEBC3|nr:hypothetical protein [Pasteurella testudinis]
MSAITFLQAAVCKSRNGCLYFCPYKVVTALFVTEKRKYGQGLNGLLHSCE